MLAGRERELARVDAFVAATGGGASGLLLRGPAGIGKTAIWWAALDRLRAAGHLVLVTRPAEEELRGTMIGLLDLFEDIDADAAVLDPDTDLFDRGRAVLATLRRLTDAGPVVLAIDDVQWLDPITARSLRYALRRLEDRPVRVLATERTSPEGAQTPLLIPDRTEQIALEPLPIEAIRQVLAPVVATIPRPALELVHELSGGNPMYALELARSTDLNRDRLAASSRSTLDRTLSARLAATPPAIRDVVRTSAALGPATPERLRAACRAPSALDDLAGAIDRDLLTLDDSMLVRCAHPLLGSVALGDMEPDARRALHGWLADVVSDPDDRARHVALASVDRDEARAAELEDAAGRADRRGAPGLAADFAAHSLRLTPLDDRAALTRRAVAEILHRVAAGETGRALAMIDAIVAVLPPGPERFAALVLRVRIDPARAEQILTQAEEAADADELVRGRVLDLLAYMTYLFRGQLARGRALETEALSIARRHGDDELEMLASATLSNIAVLSGDPRPDLMDRALELGREYRSPRIGRWPDIEHARQALWAGHLDRAREIFLRRQSAAARSGIEFQRPLRAMDMTFVELAAGQLAVAAELVGDGLESALDAGSTSIAMWLRYPDGLVHAHLGTDDERVRQAVAELRAWGDDRGEDARVMTAHHVAGVFALARDDAETALGELRQGAALARQMGFAHPGVIPVLPDFLEAAAATGATDLARELAAELESQAVALGLPWVDAAATRGRGLASLTAGESAADDLAVAAAAFDGLGYRLDAARAWWWHGRALQRAGRRRPAADALADARDRFAALGAAPWETLAATDLERVAPGRATGALTDEEARIAALVAHGRRNREIAAELFVSVATVEAHLTRIYRKLGVRSRTELSRHVVESSR